jgi:N-acetylglucosaminyldiphosphoundecaprenol N-acetyl-beta-D-mannosaminyltransferase
MSVASMDEAASAVCDWALGGRSEYVCAVNVHSTMEASRDSDLLRALAAALGAPGQDRVFGPSLMWEVCARASELGIPVGLYGSTQTTLVALRETLLSTFPALRIVEAISPPFRPLTVQEDESYVARLVASGARVVFVGLGAPKQEIWMAAHRGRLDGVMMGVGAAFDYHAGRIRRAPLWMQNAGLEWMYRLMQEPRRLWKRYVLNNPLYLLGLGTQILRERVLRSGSRMAPR